MNLQTLINRTGLQLLFFLALPVFGQQSVLNSGNWYHLTTQQDGVHRLTYEDLSDYGILNSPVPSSSISLFSNGPGMLPEENWIERPFDLEEIRIAVVDQGDGTFGPGDYILFYGTDQTIWSYDLESGLFEHSTNLYEDKTHFFLSLSEGEGLRIGPINYPLYPPNHNVNSFTDYALHEIELRNLYRSGKKWFGENFEDQLTHDFVFHFPHIKSDTTATCHVDLISRSLGTGNFNTFIVDANGVSSDFEVINVSSNYLNDYVRAANHTFEFSPSGNQIDVSVTLDPVSSSSAAWINFVKIQAERSLNLSGVEQLHFRNTSMIAENGATLYTLDSFSGLHEVWDISQFNQPVRMTGILDASGVFEFSNNHDILREYVCFIPDNALTPEYHGIAENQNLKGQPFAQGFIVTAPEFLAQAEQLAAFHETHSGLSVNIATTHQIYNEFSGGSKDITAIKDYLRHFYNAAPSEVEKPQYLCLLGNASFDYKGHQYPETDWVPTFQSESSFAPITSYCSDDYYGLLDQNESNGLGQLIDLRIGRLPARSIAEAQTLVNKITAYASNPEPGDWQLNVLFVADDEDNNIHMTQSNQLSNHIQQDNCAIHIHKTYFDAFEQISTPNGDRYPEATEAILNRLEEGVLFCNYTGHSGYTNWAAENVLVDTMLEQLQNAHRLPLFFLANCEFSRFDSPAQLSGSQRLMINPNGGAIASISNSRLGYSSSNYVFNNHFNNKLFEMENGEYHRLGDLIMNAKNASVSTNVMSHRSINLLGDPMLRLNYPRLNLAVTNVTGSDAFPGDVVAQYYSNMEVEGEVTNVEGDVQFGFNGPLTYLILDAEVPLITLGNDGFNPFNYKAYVDTLAIGTAEVENGYFSFSAPITSNGNGHTGQGKIILFAHDENETGWGCFTEFTSFQSPVSTENIEVLQASFYPNPVGDMLFVETDKLYPQVTARLFDSTGKLVMTEVFSSLDRFGIPFSHLSAGPYMLQLEADQQRTVVRVVKSR